MNNLPRVAVIITNHNYGEYVACAIKSAAQQDYKGPLEIIVVDDASTDNSIDIIHEFTNCGKFLDSYFKRDSDNISKRIATSIIDNKNFTLISLIENVKQGLARNIAIREAWDRADYFAILDADDEMMPDKISLCIEKAMEFPDQIGSVHTDYLIENTDTGAVTYEAKPPYSKQLLMMGDCHLHSGGVISKAALAKVGLFDEDCVPKEDYHMWLKISDFFMCVHIPEPLVKVRVTPKNSTVSHSDEYHIQQIRLMWTKYADWRSKVR